VGWIATRDAAVRVAVQAYKDYTTICSSAPAERLAVVALKSADRLVARCRGIVEANRLLVEAFTARHVDRFAWRAPLAGPVAFVRFEPGDASAFCARLAREAGVMLLPASVFDLGREPRALRLRPCEPVGRARRARPPPRATLTAWSRGRPEKRRVAWPSRPRVSASHRPARVLLRRPDTRRAAGVRRDAGGPLRPGAIGSGQPT
jgi:hypothetical protein